MAKRTKARRTEPITLSIDDLAYGGEGVGRHNGQVHFVSGAYPGERVRVVPAQGRKRWMRARLIEVLEESPHRIPPRCSHTDLCGGCAYQTLAYPAQLEAKAHQVRENLARIGGLHPQEAGPPLGSPLLSAYRNKMEFSFAPRSWDPVGIPETPAPGPALGLHVRGRFDAVFDVLDCMLFDPEVNRLLATVREFALARGIPAYHGRDHGGILRHLVVRASQHTGEWLVALVATEAVPDLTELAILCCRQHPRIAGFLLWRYQGIAAVARADEEILLSGRDRIIERLGPLDFELSASSFFQTNSAGAACLIEQVRALSPHVETILDLYCGVGTLGLGLADHCSRLVGIESAESAVQDARRNALRNDIRHASFETATAEDWLPKAGSLRPDLVVVDPPRAGLHPRALSGLLQIRPGVVIYVSCNPATLARDLKALVAEGYQPDSMRILDMFPHTPHVETIVRLST